MSGENLGFAIFAGEYFSNRRALCLTAAKVPSLARYPSRRMLAFRQSRISAILL